MPNIAEPSIFAAPSIRGSAVPISVKSVRTFNFTCWGTGNLAAGAANSPYEALLPEACDTRPARAAHS